MTDLILSYLERGADGVAASGNSEFPKAGREFGAGERAVAVRVEVGEAIAEAILLLVRGCVRARVRDLD